MMYLAAIFMAPLYFLLRGKWGNFVINAIFYGVALLLFVTVILAPVGLVFWLVTVIHAMWHLRREMMEEHATLIATKMAETMAAGQAQSPR